MVPAGTVMTVAADPASDATVVYCDPDDCEALEAALVPPTERADVKYSGFSLMIDLDLIGSRCDLVV